MAYFHKCRLIAIGCFVLAVLMLPVSIRAEQHAEPAPRMRFIGSTSLDALMRGENGRGALLYYLPERGIERPSLIVRLNKAPDQDVAVAEVFDAPPDTDYVPYRMREGQVSLDAALKPTITIKALGGWWRRDGRTNFNLDAQLNGPIYGMWGGGYSPETGPQSWGALVRPGQPAVSVKIRDPDGEGLPLWDLRLLIPDFPNRGFIRTHYVERKCHTPTQVDLGASPRWPFVAEAGSFEQPAGVLRPPIVVDWQRGRITHFSELVTTRNQNCSYTVYAVNKPREGQVNQLDFESPFAFYDLSGQGKGFPNLIMRTERYPAQDQWSSPIGPYPKADDIEPAPQEIETIRYSWRNAVGDGRWDYKVELLGFHTYTSETTIAGGQFIIDAPSYEQFPEWTIGKHWPIVTFIDTEGTGYVSTEGIYDWPPRAVGTDYLWGLRNQPTLTDFADIRRGLRGEYRVRQDLPPVLYISPVDNRLHLLGAEGGVWRLDDERVLRVHNLGGAQHINGWTRERIIAGTAAVTTTMVEEQIYALPDYLVHAEGDVVEMRRAAVSPALFEITPPTDKATWQMFRERVEPFTSQKRDPNDMHSWLAAFPGESLLLKPARLSDVRQTSDGFRFVLEALPGFSAPAAAPEGLRSLQPGRYAVTYNGTFNIAPLTPPTISATLLNREFAQHAPNAVMLELRNDGLQDAPNATLELWAAAPIAAPTLVTTQTVDLLAGVPITPTLQWAPQHAGDWTLQPLIRVSGQPELPLTAIQVNVEAAPSPASPSIVAASASWPVLILVGVALIAFAGLGMLIVWRQWRNVSEEGAL